MEDRKQGWGSFFFENGDAFEVGAAFDITSEPKGCWLEWAYGDAVPGNWTGLGSQCDEPARVKISCRPRVPSRDSN